MYGSVQHSGRRTRVVGLVTAAAITVGAGYVFATGMKLDINPLDESKMEMVILTPPEPPPPLQPPPPGGASMVTMMYSSQPNFPTS